MQIRLDDQTLHVDDGLTLAQLLAQHGPDDNVATALNGRFVPREARAAAVLSEGDQVLLFKPIVGG